MAATRILNSRFCEGWAGRTLPLGLAALISLQGCSLIFATPPPSAHSGTHKGSCTSSAALPVLDGVFAGIEVVRIGFAVDGPDQVDGAPFNRTVDILLGVALGTLFIASAAYGADVASDCKAYEREERRLKASREANPETQAYSPRTPTRDEDEADADEEPAHAPPSGGVGFEFGEPLEAVQQRCAARQGTWSADASGSSCSWTNGPSHVRVALDFCDGGVVDLKPRSLCHIGMSSTLANQDGLAWGKLFTSLTAELRRTFGKPARVRLRYPEECRNPALFYQCLLERKVVARHTWDWENGHTLSLTLGQGGQGTPAVEVNFATRSYLPPPINPAPVTPPSSADTSAATPAAGAPAVPSSSNLPVAPAAPKAPQQRFPDAKTPTR